MTFVTFPAFRQRVQTRTRCVRPATSARIDTRFGSQRRRARFRFIPTDWGFQPVIGRLPQMSQTRAMVEGVSTHEKAGAGRRNE